MLRTVKALVGMATGIGGVVEGAPGARVGDVAVRTRDGGMRPLSKYAGQVLMVVNVASKCGCTPQYHDLVALQQRFQDRGFRVLGFPCNDFAGQEPGTADEVANSCSTRFGAEFEIFEKVRVKGGDCAPLYARLTGPANGPYAGAIGWNFTKFLLDRQGVVRARLEPHVKPGDPRVINLVEALLSA
jgi:glutathione peroxidase